MFDESLIESLSRRRAGRKRLTFPLAIAFECLVIGALATVPMLRIAALPQAEQAMNAIAAPSAPSASASRRRPASEIFHRMMPADLATEPVEIPQLISRAPEPPLAPAPAEFMPGGIGVPGGMGPGGVAPGRPGTPLPPPPRLASKSQKTLRVGSVIQAAKLIYGSKPVYPQLALMARTQGTVRLEAVIGKDGKVSSLKVLTSNPLLVQAALDAISQWKYEPTLLNDEPVEVETEIDVVFKLEE